jgi:hypothetical protein
VYLVDTPGFDDPHVSDAHTLKNITEILVKNFTNNVEIQGALYVHPVTEVKMRGSGKKNLIMFTKMLGDAGMRHCRLVTTKWSLQPMHVSEAREKELCEKEEFWEPLIANGAKTVRFGDSMQSAIDIIKPLVHGSAFMPLIVSEVVELHKTPEQTQAGIFVTDDIEELKKACAQDIADNKEEEARARAQQKFEFAEILLAERRESEAKMRRLEEDMDALRKPISSSGRIGRWIARGTAAVIGTVMTIGSGGLLGPAAMALYSATEAGAQIHKHTSH